MAKAAAKKKAPAKKVAAKKAAKSAPVAKKAAKKVAPKKKAAAKKTATKKSASAKKAAPKKKPAAKAKAKKAATKTSTKKANKEQPAAKKSAPAAKKAATAAAKKAAPAAAKKAAPAAKKASKKPAAGAGATQQMADLVLAFKQLAIFAQRDPEANGFAARAYDNAAKVLDDYVSKGKVIASGASMSGYSGIGPASVAKIDEFLTTGKIAKLEAYIAEWGPLDANVLAGAKSVLKSGGGAAAGGAGAGGAGSDKDGVVRTAITKAVEKEIRAAAEQLSRKTNAALQAELRLNGAKTSGTKTSLVNRAAHQVVLGCTPGRCPLCGGGRPAFSNEDASPIPAGAGVVFMCKGFYDDTTYRSCTFRVAPELVQREGKWRTQQGEEEQEKANKSGDDWFEGFGNDSDGDE